MNKYVGIETADGHAYDGFIAHVDQNYVTLAVPTNEMIDRLNGLPAEESTYRQFGFHPGFFQDAVSFIVAFLFSAYEVYSCSLFLLI